MSDILHLQFSTDIQVEEEILDEHETAYFDYEETTEIVIVGEYSDDELYSIVNTSMLEFNKMGATACELAGIVFSD